MSKHAHRFVIAPAIAAKGTVLAGRCTCGEERDYAGAPGERFSLVSGLRSAASEIERERIYETRVAGGARQRGQGPVS